MPSGSTYLLTLVLLAACSGFSFLIMQVVARLSGTRGLFRLILLPGIILHELAHALACLMTATPIVRISFWDPNGGSVTHHEPKLAVITQPFISFAPFPIGLTALYFLAMHLTALAWYWAVPVIILMVSIAATLSPSKTDAINAVEGIILMIAVLLALFFLAPSWIHAFGPWVARFNSHLVWLVGGLGALWCGLTLIFHVMHRHVR